RPAPCSTSSRSTAAPASRATAAARRSRRPAPGAAAPGTARTASSAADPAPALRGEQLVECARAVEAPELGVAADRAVVDDDLRDGPAPGEVEEALAEGGIVVEAHLVEVETPAVEERFRTHAVAAPARRIHLDPRHVLG